MHQAAIDSVALHFCPTFSASNSRPKTALCIACPSVKAPVSCILHVVRFCSARSLQPGQARPGGRTVCSPRPAEQTDSDRSRRMTTKTIHPGRLCWRCMQMQNAKCRKENDEARKRCVDRFRDCSPQQDYFSSFSPNTTNTLRFAALSAGHLSFSVVIFAC